MISDFFKWAAMAIMAELFLAASIEHFGIGTQGDAAIGVIALFLLVRTGVVRGES